MLYVANSSRLSTFILLGLTDNSELEVPLFTTFTLIYLITLIGNLGMIVLIWLDSRLHTPMYFFLSNLSLADCVYSSTVTPKVMAGLLTGDKVISYGGCVAQMFFFVSFASVDCFLLAVMAFDRHAAVCKPLHYATTMTTIILTSYAFIFIAILRMRSAEGRKKAFSTCASHLTAVTIFYGTVIFMYLQPSSSHSMDNDQTASVFYTIVVPMLNPIVYSLRNKEVHSAFKKVVEKMKTLISS
ncbi:Olfactory receptor 5B2 [Microtus ochrogaster]|uniref:Olfactory receptor 5B2 n=1 Tax=Microtus ochrogaster TaxID=79684 RepID=A0A8J6KVM2_MICOH|nr:Olfactory receptor 5B2 [Microtus ochrogaster]